MKAQIRAALREVARFEKKKRIPHLVNAIREMESLEVDDDTERRDAFIAWTSVMRAIERNEDPAFDPADMPETNAIPPGFMYPTGVSPSAVADPALRKQYKDLLSKNQEKAVRYEFQDQVRRQDVRAAEDIEAFLLLHYTRSAADQAEIKTVLESSELSAARQQAILQAGSR